MAKINIDIYLKNHIDKTIITKKEKAILNNQIISFNDDNILMKIDIKNKHIIRENDEYKVVIPLFLNTQTHGEYLLKKQGVKFNIDIFTKKIEIDDYNLEFEYIIKVDNEVTTHNTYKIKL